MALDGLFHFLYGACVFGCAHYLGVLVASHIEGYDFCEVVFMSFLLLFGTLDKGYLSVIISIVTGIEGVPPARFSGVLLCGACRESKEASYTNQGEEVFFFRAIHLYGGGNRVSLPYK